MVAKMVKEIGKIQSLGKKGADKRVFLLFYLKFRHGI